MAARKKPRRIATKAARGEVAKAERAAGGMRALARKMRVSPSTISRWRREGPSLEGMMKLAEYKELRKAVKHKKKAEKATFEELMKLAKSEELPEHKRLPQGRSSEGRRTGPLTSGRQSTRGWNRMLNLDLVDDIEAWMLGVSKKYPIWQATVVVSQYGAGKHRGYKTVYFQVPHPEAGDFAIKSVVATHKSTHKDQVVGELRQKLEQMAGDPSIKVYVHTSTLYNYRMKSDAERRAFVTARRKKWPKKRKK